MTQISEIVIGQNGGPESGALGKKPFVERLLSAAGVDMLSSGSGIIAFQEYALYLDVVAEALARLEEDAGHGLLLVADLHTARHFSAFQLLAGKAERVVLVGGKDATELALAEPAPPAQILEQGDHVFAACSEHMSVLVAGAIEPGKTIGESLFCGAWSVDRALVFQVAGAIVGAVQCADIQDANATWSPVQAKLAMNMMGRYSSFLYMRQHDMARDKDDLFSVLDILKAISSKRRAHDILYVFVEQIARVVNSDRCSVVRIWGSSEEGAVMASHEDASFSGQTIELTKYPEIKEAIATEEKVVINDVTAHPLTAPHAAALTAAGFRSILVIPIVVADQNVGTLLLRAARRAGAFAPREVGFFEIVSEAAANALERAHLFESIQLANERLERLAVTDGLTGLHNHRYFREQLEQELDRARRYEQPLSCMILDVDNFKMFNDTHGHLAGDFVLREIAVRIQQCVRRTDVVARYGGEEFVVLMPQTDLRGGIAQAERVRERIAATPFAYNTGPLLVTASFGVSALDRQRSYTSEDMIREADQALYQAKRTGKNRVVGPETVET